MVESLQADLNDLKKTLEEAPCLGFHEEELVKIINFIEDIIKRLKTAKKYISKDINPFIGLDNLMFCLDYDISQVTNHLTENDILPLDF